ncbi:MULTISPECIES: hypothetical protein [unclassified Clostridioides]|uniref:hypothetical protein n=1 Tax=unclassified Clostridioides TaxID=2635829 RepID=UPI001D110392|nr:hypothetical protein [Clostridioides sp. ES-S-0171-01]MCC0688217.1 hypothetical protein [Clostridioides sp. ES-S-0056-01]MCC0715873.1 hypothetical protein [Clostridioides sp. ES-S-0077-01]UDN54295.1 hypothetical protein JJC02_15665 [Clostridioides sp. ES-S-0054-01]
MYQYCDLDDCCISLHDCFVEKMDFDNGILSFVFPDGFWIIKKHSQNKSNTTVRTNSSQVDFQIIDEEIDGIEIYVFKGNGKVKTIRENWEPINFITAINNGKFRIEFITQYKNYQSFLFKCWACFDKSPYHLECEIILHSNSVAYRWNKLRYDCIW